MGWGKPRSKPSLKILSVGLVLIITRSVIPSSFRVRNKTVLAGTILFKSNINSNISLKIQNKYIATRWLPASRGWLICNLMKDSVNILRTADCMTETQDPTSFTSWSDFQQAVAEIPCSMFCILGSTGSVRTTRLSAKQSGQQTEIPGVMTHHQELNRNGVTVRKAELRHKPMISIKFPFFSTNYVPRMDGWDKKTLRG